MTKIDTSYSNGSTVGESSSTSSSYSKSSSKKSVLSLNSTGENDSVLADFNSTGYTSKATLLSEIEAMEKRIRELKEERAELSRKMNKLDGDKRQEYRDKIKEIDSAVDSCYAQIYSLTSQLNMSSLSTSKTQDSYSTCGSSTSVCGASISDGNFDSMLQHVLGYEGGYSNDPDDRGGATNFGITQATYTAYKGKYVDVRNISLSEAKDIYYKNYYVASGASEIAKTNPALAFAVFDASVNHGVGWAKKALNQCGGNVDKFMEIRKNYYKQIVANNSSQRKFAKGWQNRWNKVYSVINPSHQYENYI